MDGLVAAVNGFGRLGPRVVVRVNGCGYRRRFNRHVASMVRGRIRARSAPRLRARLQWMLATGQSSLTSVGHWSIMITGTGQHGPAANGRRASSRKPRPQLRRHGRNLPRAQADMPTEHIRVSLPLSLSLSLLSPSLSLPISLFSHIHTHSLTLSLALSLSQVLAAAPADPRAQCIPRNTSYVRN